MRLQILELPYGGTLADGEIAPFVLVVSDVTSDEGRHLRANDEAIVKPARAQGLIIIANRDVQLGPDL